MIRTRAVIKNDLENKLKKGQRFKDINGRVCFITLSGGFLRLDTIGGADDSIVIEFAENEREANNNRFEDDDIFDIREYSEDAVFKMVLEAIQSY